MIVTAQARNEWFYQRDGKKHGPIGLEALGDLLDRGEVAWTDLVWKDGFSEWVPANRAPHVCFLQDMDGLLSGDQHTRDTRSNGSGVFSVRCGCGAKLRVPVEAKKRRLRCPKCASSLRVKGVSGAHEKNMRSSRKDQSPQRASRTNHVMLWSSVVLFIAVSSGFIWWLLDQHGKYEQRRADERCAATIAKAIEWLDDAGKADRETGTLLKQQLEAAIAGQVSDPKAGQDIVASLQKRLDAIDAAKAAEDIFAKGKAYLDDGKVEDALTAFRDYATNPAATHRDECEKLLLQIHNATDEEAIREWLIRRDDDALQAMKDRRGEAFGDVSHPVLLSRQAQLAPMVAGQILDDRKERSQQIKALADQEAKVAGAKAAMKAAWERRKERLAKQVGPAVSRTNRQQLAAAGVEFMTWMMTQKNHEPAAVQKAIDSFNKKIHPVGDSGDASRLAMALQKLSPADISILDDAIETSIWGRMPASLTKTQGELWLQAWESAFLTGTMIEENPPSPPKPKEIVVYVNDVITPRTQAELQDIHTRILAKAHQELRAEAARSAERSIAMSRAVQFLVSFGNDFKSGRKDHIVSIVQQVDPQLENGIQLLLNQTEFGNALLRVSHSDKEARYLTYSEIWDRAHEMRLLR